MAFWFGYLCFAALIGSITMALMLIIAWLTIKRFITAKMDAWALHHEIHAYLTREENR